MRNYPGTKLAITEYSFGSLDTITGALAQPTSWASSAAKEWIWRPSGGPPKPTDPGAFAWKIYRQLRRHRRRLWRDRRPGRQRRPGQLSVYAALRSDLNLTVMVINKTANNLSTTLALSNFNARCLREGLAVQRE